VSPGLRLLVPSLIDAMERHGHLQLAPEVRGGLPAMSAATIDRALREVRGQAGGGRRRASPSAGVRRSVPVRTFADWDDPAPGFTEADLVAHSGPTAEGSFVQTLTLTDSATGWTECAPLLVREQTLLTEVLGEVRKRLPFPLLGFDTDNDSVFMNETVRDTARRLALSSPAAVRIARTTRPLGRLRRPLLRRRIARAMVEQKNGAVVRRIAGCRRTVGLEAAATLGRLYGSVRLFVNFFQPSLKLAGKVRDGAKVTKRCHAPATPCQRLMADPRTSDEVRRRVSASHVTLDPVRLLSEIRLAQQQLVEIADRPVTGEAAAPSAPTLAQFLLGLRASWQEGEVRPTAKPKKRVAPCCRHVPDPFEAVSAQVRGWFEAEPWRTARELLERLQGEHPGAYPEGQLRTLQRRLKGWRREVARTLVFGPAAIDEQASVALQTPLRSVT